MSKIGATEQNLLKLFGALMDDRLNGTATIPTPVQNKELIY